MTLFAQLSRFVKKASVPWAALSSFMLQVTVSGQLLRGLENTPSWKTFLPETSSIKTKLWCTKKPDSISLFILSIFFWRLEKDKESSWLFIFANCMNNDGNSASIVIDRDHTNTIEWQSTITRGVPSIQWQIIGSIIFQPCNDQIVECLHMG